MKKTLVRLKVQREVVRILTHRDLTTAAAGANSPTNPNGTKEAGGCAGGAALEHP